MSLSSFMRELSSVSPAPGGGSVAAVSAAMGASLIAKVCHLTEGKKKYADVEGLMRQTSGQADALKHDMLCLADLDAAALRALIALYRQGSYPEKEKAVQKALTAAAEAPWQTILGCDQVLCLAGRIAGKSNQNLDSDVAVAVEMAISGMKSGIVNVEVNLRHIQNTDYVQERRQSMASRLEAAAAKQERIARTLASRRGDDYKETGTGVYPSGLPAAHR
jgi:formiminotetrahydrofolate cyclodeaminase